MKIKLIETIKQEKEFDIKFPIYKEHDVTADYGGLSIYYTRIDLHEDESLTCTDIHISGDNQVEITIRNNYKFGRDNIDYLLGKGEYLSSKEEFEEALKKTKEIIKKI